MPKRRKPLTLAQRLEEAQFAAQGAIDLVADAENHIAEAEKLLSKSIDNEQVAYDARGKIMDGEDPKSVLEWVLTQVSGEEIVL